MRTYTDTPNPKDRWGKVTSSLDEARNLQEFEQRLKGLGFPDYEELISRVGKVRLYTHQGQNSFSYEYCCVIYIGRSGTPVFLKGLPDVLRLMAEIGAHLPQDTAVEDQLEEIKSRLWEAVSLIREQPTVQDLEEVKQPLQETTSLLKGFTTTVLTKMTSILGLDEEKSSQKNGR